MPPLIGATPVADDPFFSPLRKAPRIQGRPIGASDMAARALSEVLCGRFAAVAACVEDARIAEPSLSGTVGLTLEIDGRVVGVKLAKGAPALAACLGRAWADVATPPTARGAVGYELTLAVPVAVLREHVLSVRGRLPAEVARRTVRRGWSKLEACRADVQRRRPGARGRITVDVDAAATGVITKVKASSTGLADAHECVERAIASLAFPELDGAVAASIALDFAFE